MASLTRVSWSTRWPGGTTARMRRSKATRPARSPSRVATAVSISTASMACSTRATPGDLARHGAPVVEGHDHRLVAFRPVGAHDRLAGAGGGGPVHAAGLVVDAVLPELVELGAPAPAPGRAQPDVEDPGPVDAQLRLLAGGERRVHPQQPGQLPSALPGQQAERAGDPDHDLPGLEPTPPAGLDGGLGRDPCPGRAR